MIENQRFGAAGLEATAAGKTSPPEIGPTSPYRGACSHTPQVLTGLAALWGGNRERGAWGSGGGCDA